MTGAVAAFLAVAALPFALCLLLALAGGHRTAWKIAAAITAVSVAIPVWFQLADTHGQAGLAGALLVVFLLGPATAGALLGAGLGHMLARLRRG